jgi:rod shape determining protein RodA
VYNEQHQSIFDISQRYGKQLLWIVAALVLALIVMLIEGKFYEYFAYIIYGLSILLLIFVLFIGKEVNSAKSWVAIGSFQFQPSEFAKYATCLAVAKYLTKPNFSFHNRKDLFRSIMIPLLPFLLIALQPDFGSSIVYLAFIIVFYRSGLSPVIPVIGILTAVLFILSLVVDNINLIISIYILFSLVFAILHRRFKYFITTLLLPAFLFGIYRIAERQGAVEIELFYLVLLILGISLLYFNIHALSSKIKNAFLITVIFIGIAGFTLSVDYVFRNFLEPHQQKRISVLIGLEEDPQGAGYNVKQSKIAIGSGGFSGKGFLQGTQTKYRFVPEQSTDFIFCTVGEEWGFMGTTTVVILFAFLLLRLVMLAERQRSRFSTMYGYSIIGIFFLHFMINIAMTIGLFPVIGIPLPFFSYGGSSLWAFTVMLFTFLKLDSIRMNTMMR